MELPDLLLHSLRDVKGFNKEAFERVHASGEQVTSIRLNPTKPVNTIPSPTGSSGRGTNLIPLPLLKLWQASNSSIPWSKYGLYLAERPSFTFDPLFHAGCYYVQEASSMFLEQAIMKTTDLTRALKVLDLCAAPGGKSTHILSLISKDSLLVSNETIRTRVNILNDNIIKWGTTNTIVTNNDPRDFGKITGYFDLLVVDAPCSGSGLFRRDKEAIREWSLHNVELCSQRQQRIIADALPCLKEDGVLIYSTCSYSYEEDEMIGDWLLNTMGMERIRLEPDPEWNIIESEAGYRFYPDKLKGEGFFIACFRKKTSEKEPRVYKRNRISSHSSKEFEMSGNWIKREGLEFILKEQTIYAVPASLLKPIHELRSELKVVNFGTKLGELMHGKLVPDHMLALSNIISEIIPQVDLNEGDAVRYLQKKELQIGDLRKGWHLVSFIGHNMGWINVLEKRVNNYYPKELRILKEKNNEKNASL